MIRRGIWRGCITASLAFSILFGAITFSPLVLWWAQSLSGAWNDSTGDILIVLGSEVQPDGVIGESSYWRTVYAVRAWRAGGFRRVIFTGAGAAPAMRQFAMCQGIPSEAIEVESESVSTRENALRTAALLRGRLKGRPVLLTSDFHMFRALRVFQKAGLPVEPRPFPDIGKRANFLMNRWPAFGQLLLESAKIGWYWWKRWI